MSVKRFLEVFANKDIIINIIDKASDELIETVYANDEYIMNDYKTVKAWAIYEENYTTSIEVYV